MIKEIADLTRGPEARQPGERAAETGSIFDKDLVGIGEAHGFAVHVTGEGDIKCAAGAIAPDHHYLTAAKQIGQRGGVEIIDIEAAKVQLEVGEHRRADAGIERRQDFIQRLAGFDVSAEAVMILRKRVQQVGIDIIAYAKGKQAQVAGRSAGKIIQDAGAVNLTLGGQAIGQEDEIGGALTIGHGSSIQQGQVDIGAAGGALAAQPGNGRAGFTGGAQVRCVGIHAAAEGGYIKTVSGVEVFQNEPGGRLGLDKLFAIHAARAIHHQENIFVDDLVNGFGVGGQQQHEKTIGILRIVGGAVAEKMKGLLFAQGIVKREIGVRQHIGAFVADPG